MNNAIFNIERPENEPTFNYAPGCKERKALNAELDRMSAEVLDIPAIIGGKEVRTGNTGKVVMPHDHQHTLANYHMVGENEIRMAIDAAIKAHKEWESFSWVDRVSITLKIADLVVLNHFALRFLCLPFPRLRRRAIKIPPVVLGDISFADRVKTHGARLGHKHPIVIRGCALAIQVVTNGKMIGVGIQEFLKMKPVQNGRGFLRDLPRKGLADHHQRDGEPSVVHT